VIDLLVVTPFGRRLGGSDNILLSFLRTYDQERLRPSVVFLEPGPFEREVAGLGVTTRALPPGRLRNPRHVTTTVMRLRQVFRETSPDLILNWLSTAQVYGAPAAAATGLADRSLWWQLDQHSGPRVSRGKLLDRLATALPAVAVGCCSASVAEAQARIRPRRHTFSVLPGIPEPRQATASELRGLRSRLGLPPAPAVVIGTIGRLFPWKGHHRLLQAVAMLRDQGIPAHALVVGGGGHRGDDRYERELEALARSDRLRGAVTFTGQVPDAAVYAGLMDVFVNASDPEPFGLVLLEAMAAGVPVVAVDRGGPREIVQDGLTGSLVAGGGAEHLHAGIEPLARDVELRKRLGTAGKARFEAAFSEARMGAEMSDRLVELAP
jgi:glycosyltransferase involved in cell wall biosynthesis